MKIGRYPLRISYVCRLSVAVCCQVTVLGTAVSGRRFSSELDSAVPALGVGTGPAGWSEEEGTEWEVGGFFASVPDEGCWAERWHTFGGAASDSGHSSDPYVGGVRVCMWGLPGAGRPRGAPPPVLSVLSRSRPVLFARHVREAVRSGTLRGRQCAGGRLRNGSGCSAARARRIPTSRPSSCTCRTTPRIR